MCCITPLSFRKGTFNLFYIPCLFSLINFAATSDNASSSRQANATVAISTLSFWYKGSFRSSCELVWVGAVGKSPAQPSWNQERCRAEPCPLGTSAVLCLGKQDLMPALHTPAGEALFAAWEAVPTPLGGTWACLQTPLPAWAKVYSELISYLLCPKTGCCRTIFRS